MSSFIFSKMVLPLLEATKMQFVSHLLEQLNIRRLSGCWKALEITCPYWTVTLKGTIASFPPALPWVVTVLVAPKISSE